MNLRWRLVLAFLLVILLSLGITLFFTLRGATQQVTSFVAKGGLFGLEKNVQALEEYYQINGSWQGAEALLAPMGAFQAPQTRQSLGTRRMGGEGGSQSTGMRPYDLRLVDADGLLVFDQSGVSPHGTDVSAELSRAIELNVGKEIVGYLLPESGLVFPQSDTEAAIIERLLPAILTAAAVAGAFSIALAMLVAVVLLRPVRELTLAAQQVAGGDLSQRVTEEGPQELALLGSSFNRMAQELQQTDKRRKDLVADIAHELRTPLAVQQANLEAMLDGIYPLNKKNVETVLEQNALLKRLVEDLRLLALADAGELPLEMRKLDLSKLTANSLRRFAAQAGTQQVQLINEIIKEPMFVLADAARIEQIIHNLLQNALQYASREGQVSVTLHKKDEQALLRVRDNGPGIDEKLLPYLFDRFQRRKKAPSASPESTGLGLAIAKKLAQMMGGDLTAKNHPQGGALFTLQMPLMGD